MKRTLTALAIAALPLAGVAAETDGAQPAQVAVTSTIELTSQHKAALRSFRAFAGYYGALAIDTASDEYQWFNNFHSIEHARDAALRGCNALSATASCVIYAVSFPAGEDPNAPARHADLSADAAKDFHGRYMRKQQAGKYGAFAVSGIAEHWMSWQWDTPEEARAFALKGCEDYTRRTKANLDDETWAWAKARGKDSCRIVHETGPSH